MAEKKNPVPEAEVTAPEQQKAPDKGENKKAATKKPGNKLEDIEAKIASAEQKVAEAEKKLEEMKDNLMRTAAEYDNYRKRTQKEQEATFGNGVGHAACELLPVLDTLDVAAAADTTDPEYKKGVVLTLAKCNEVFQRLGIQEIKALGEPFDPELHNAVMQDPVEGVASGTITQVMQKGYTLNGRVIRHAMVAVAP